MCLRHDTSRASEWATFSICMSMCVMVQIKTSSKTYPNLKSPHSATLEVAWPTYAFVKMVVCNHNLEFLSRAAGSLRYTHHARGKAGSIKL